MSNSSESLITRNLPTIITLIMIIVLFLTFFWSYVFISIKSGEVGILYRRFGQGTVTDTIYQEGITLILPWNIMYIYDTRIQQYKHSMIALTREGLKVDLEISIRYYPELETVGILHQRVGPDYLHKIVVPEVESNIRVQVGHLDIDNMYSPDPALLQVMVNDTMDQLEKNYITIQDVVITRITLPKSIETAMEKKIEYKELAEAYQYRIEGEKLEAKRKLIEADGIRAYNETIDKSITLDILKWQGIQATVALSNSNNSKVVVIGNSSKEMPIILGGESEAPKR